ncbi:MAG: insulinase family protein [Deltaproteobacteria bacterium]|jgi:Zn-dependent M16 (insulinase) family peptidase|nr:insulinase family protein [Deltaproteobacteria bacterium]
MNAITDPSNPDLTAGGRINEYQIERVEPLPDISSVFYELKHLRTGAKHIHISNGDAENTFGVAFKTVPHDSTGVAHILEHTVLCGSRQYPVRDPFFSMLKRSLSTFMNAFTASDWTMYPFSTQNRKDFYNLMGVYLDAAFFPRLDGLSFKQEGHRLEIATPSESNDPAAQQLTYKGVVYNEMKGAMSSPDQVMVRSILKALYPSTTYRFNSGGEPAEIPSLTHSQLKEFHRRHYHPSNAFFYTYGNLPLRDHLSFIDAKVLKSFKPIDHDTNVASQPRWKQPRTESYPYPLDQNEDPTKKCQVCVAWLTADIKDSFEVLVLTLLEQILLGNPASPLRQALIDSGLGSALCDGTGFDADNRDTLFVSGLKDVASSDAARIEAIILGVLRDLAENGVDKTLIDSAIHQIEFHRKEITNTPYPYGIKLLLTFSGSWFHGGDPVKILNFDADLTRLRKELADGSFFENRIKKYFLDNTHRATVTLVPDQEMASKENDRLGAELERIKKDLVPSDIDRIKQDAEALIRLQETEEDISCLPTLERKDIPSSVPSVQESAADGAIPATLYNQATSGIFYLAAAAGGGALPDDLAPLAPFFCYAASRMGTAVRDYAEMARRIDAYTGGIGLSTHARTRFDGTGECLPFVSINAKCLDRNRDQMFDILQELLHQSDFSDLTRLKNLLLEYRAGLESMVIHNGHRLAISLASRNLSATRRQSEIWNGVHQLQTIKALADKLTDKKIKSLSLDLAAIGETLLGQKNFKMALIGEDASGAQARAWALSLIDGLGDSQDDGFKAPGSTLDAGNIREGWSTSSAVSFVAQAFETVRMEHEDAAALSIISKILRSLYLHREIREKGGAYGGFALYSPEDGLFCLASYRDPHIVSTLKAFDNAAAFIRSGSFEEEDVNEAILQVCSEIDKPDPPGPAARKSFYRSIIALTDDMREHYKSKLLNLTRRQVIQVAEKYFDGDQEKKAVAVISGEEQLKAANDMLVSNPLLLKRI